MTRFGGESEDLGFDEVGIRAEALASNTDFKVGERVTVGFLGDRRIRPFLLEPPYQVAALDNRTPDALPKSRTGEAVFSVDARAADQRVDMLGERDFVVLSGVLGESRTDRGWRLDLPADVLRELRIIQN